MDPNVWIKPMLARDLADDAVLDDPSYLCEEKVDGYRLRLVIANGRVVSMMSRNQKPIDGPGVAWLAALQFRDVSAELDGEIYVPGGTASDVAHHLTSGQELLFAVFDILRLAGRNLCHLPYWARREAARYVVDAADDQNVKMTTTFPFARVAFEDAKANGREGVVLKKADAPYEPGKRSWAWQKVKCIGTIDVIITDCDSKPTQWTVTPGNVGCDGVTYPEGKLSEPWQKGYCGLSYGYFDPKEGKAYRVGSLGVTGPREEMEAWIGKVVETKAYSVLPSGKLQHVQVLRTRLDKAPDECLAPKPTKLKIKEAV